MKYARIVPLVVALGFGFFLSACGTPGNQENTNAASDQTGSDQAGSDQTDSEGLQAEAISNGLNAEYFSSINFTDRKSVV